MGAKPRRFERRSSAPASSSSTRTAEDRAYGCENRPQSANEIDEGARRGDRRVVCQRRVGDWGWAARSKRAACTRLFARRNCGFEERPFFVPWRILIGGVERRAQSSVISAQAF